MKINVNSNIEIVYYSNKVRFSGSKIGISNLAEEIRKVSKLKDGQMCKIDKLTFKVSKYITADQNKKYWIELPDQAWNILSSKINDVVEGLENNPFDFNDCGYTNKIPYDIGVEIIDLPTSNI